MLKRKSSDFLSTGSESIDNESFSRSLDESSCDRLYEHKISMNESYSDRHIQKRICLTEEPLECDASNNLVMMYAPHLDSPKSKFPEVRVCFQGSLEAHEFLSQGWGVLHIYREGIEALPNFVRGFSDQEQKLHRVGMNTIFGSMLCAEADSVPLAQIPESVSIQANDIMTGGNLARSSQYTTSGIWTDFIPDIESLLPGNDFPMYFRSPYLLHPSLSAADEINLGSFMPVIVQVTSQANASYLRRNGWIPLSLSCSPMIIC